MFCIYISTVFRCVQTMAHINVTPVTPPQTPTPTTMQTTAQPKR
jgi:hypothetical protein